MLRIRHGVKTKKPGNDTATQRAVGPYSNLFFARRRRGHSVASSSPLELDVKFPPQMTCYLWKQPPGREKIGIAISDIFNTDFSRGGNGFGRDGQPDYDLITI